MHAAGPCVRLVPTAAAAARRLQRIFFLHEGHDLSRFLVRALHSRISAVHGRALVAISICCKGHLAGHLSKEWRVLRKERRVQALLLFHRTARRLLSAGAMPGPTSYEPFIGW